jgi:hypothetical protein
LKGFYAFVSGFPLPDQTRKFRSSNKFHENFHSLRHIQRIFVFFSPLKIRFSPG